MWTPHVPENLDPFFNKNETFPRYHRLMAYENTTWYNDPDLHPEERIYTYQLPDWSDPEGEPVAIKLISPLPFYMTFDPITRIFTVDKQ